jgi:magnesium chelatase family protein
MYANRLSGPLLDRIDMQVRMDRLTRAEILGIPSGESSSVVRQRVEIARAVQAERYGKRIATNASASMDDLLGSGQLSTSARRLLGSSIDGMRLTGRGVTRALRVARTIADLNQESEISDESLHEALLCRQQLRDKEVVA